MEIGGGQAHTVSNLFYMITAASQARQHLSTTIVSHYLL